MSDGGQAEVLERFAARLFRRLPWLRDETNAWKASEPEAPDHVLVQIASPTGDAGRSVTIWLDDGEPSVEFGPWHTHSTVWGADKSGDQWDAIIDLIEAIFADEFVLVQDVGGDHDGSTGVLDRRTKHALIDELTSKWSPGECD